MTRRMDSMKKKVTKYMQRLSATDAIWLDLETAQTPMTLGGLTVVDPLAGGKSALLPAQIDEYIAQRLQRVPVLRRKLVFPSAGLATPAMVDDRNFDLSFHVRHLALPKPGNMAQLKELASRLIGSSVDLSRPPWEFYVIEGLSDLPGASQATYAILTKFHHAIFDGGAVGAIQWAFMQDDPDEEIVDAPVSWRPEIESRSVLADFLTLPIQVGFEQWEATIKGMNNMGQVVSSALLKRLATTTDQAPTPDEKQSLLPPKTRLSGKVTANRVLDFVAVPMSELKELRNALGKPKINDIWLAVVAGGLRHYLLAHDGLPEKPLLSMCPISVRDGDPLSGGNYLSGMRVNLATHIADPIERLAVIARSTAGAKEIANDLGDNFVENLLGMQPFVARSQLTKLSAVLPEKLNFTMPSPANVTISNAPPPKGGHYFAGGKAITTFGFGPLFEGCGVLHAITGFDFESTVAVTSCREILPDIEFYMDCIRRSFAELHAAAKAG